MKISVKIDGLTYEVQVGDLYERPVIATVDGFRFEVWPEGEEPFQKKEPNKQESLTPAVKTNTTAGLTADRVISPIPGLIFLMKVKPGDRVDIGQTLCILEAMKMKNVIRSPREGRVDAVLVDNGQKVAAGDVLVVFES